ncbi:MAG: Ig-like domain-containing protein, partial [Candidatus Marinimicrobia bacterium]|nr:Ig-like domain-containing protein [Candidatus Neomarinimicrobiota bacterium]
MISNNKFLSNFGIIILLLCTLSCDNKTIDLPIADTTPPQAVIIYPVDGISVAGDITVLARATDNEEVDSVEFYINQKKVGRDNSGVNDIFDFVWKTGDYTEDEYHFVSIIAFDGSENAYASFP